MTGNFFAAGVVALAVIGAGSVGVASADPVVPRDVVVGAPLPQEPAPSNPEPSGASLPTTDEVSGMLTRLTDPGVGYKEKGDLVENGITQEEGDALDHELRKADRDGELPFTFNVLNVVPTVPNQAVANVAISGPKIPAPQTLPLTLVDQGSWVVSRDSAEQLLQALAAH